MEAPVRKSPLTVVLLLVVGIMGCEIVYLIYQNRQLRSMLTEASSLQVLQQGQAVPPFTAADLEGAQVTVQYGESEPATVLVWFSPSCHLCADNAAFWNDIYTRYETSPGIRFLVLSDSDASETRSYVAEHALRLPVVSVTQESLIDAYNGRVMPQTALISPQGTIERVWPGALEPSRQEEITAILDSLAT